MPDKKIPLGPLFERVKKGGDDIAIVFVSLNCDLCGSALTEVKTRSIENPNGFVVVCDGDQQACQRLAKDNMLTSVPISDLGQVMHRRFKVTSHPTIVVGSKALLTR
jgi:hypothetical protein